MEHHKYLRVKIYIFIVLLSFFVGWAGSNRVIVYSVGAKESYMYYFDYSGFALFLLSGFSITLIYDLFLYFKTRPGTPG